MERTLVASDFTTDTLRAVTLAYRERRQAGKMDRPASLAALTMHRQLHPEMDEQQRRGVVAQMIAIAARDYPKWFWRGVGGRGWPPPPNAYRP